jgi:hypothetical protein
MAAAKKKTAKPTPPKRKDPTPALRTALLTEAGYKCGNPNCRNIIILELHHIHWVTDGGPTEAWNLLALCPMCHGLHTQGKIPASAIKHWKGLLVALNGAFSRESTELLLYLAEPLVGTFTYKPEGILRFAGLVAAGLVEILFEGHRDYFTAKELIATNESFWTESMRVRLSEKGKLLVDSWKKGDQAEYLTALGVAPPGTEA